jgi:hypothetical protein
MVCRHRMESFPDTFIPGIIGVWRNWAMTRIAKVKVLPEYRLELEFDDGVSGTVDLSEAVGKGVFALWRDPLAFDRVRIGSSGKLVWDDWIDLCPDALYLKVTGRSRKTFFLRYATSLPMPEIRGFGVCELCTTRTSKAAMLRHLARCAPQHDRTDGIPCDLFQLRVEGRGAPMFWLDVEVKGTSPIRRLDDLLRHVWLECCGHLSALETGGFRYSVVVDNEFGVEPNERSMSAKVSQVLTSPGQRLSYEYDFGSTTELTLRLISVRTGMIGRSAARVLARNEPPAWTCGACDAPATLVCPYCMGHDNPFVCARHAPEHACAEDESFLPVVNSPRMGVCGYTGEI